jgi:anti-sigma regulatory factor (Ser/Thr protein kinase)/GNAT superfamily N-acetyltransferase
MPSIVQTELSLPADMRMLRLVQDYVRGLAQLAGLPEDQAAPLARAVWEACRNSIEHAFEGEEPGTLKLVGELTPGAMTMCLHDKGLPFYQSRYLGAPPPGPEKPASAGPPGQGLASIHRCFDEVRLIYHGVEGNELRLTKHLAGGWSLPAPEPETPGPRTEAVQPAAPRAYSIRRLRPGEGLQVAQLIYRVYGYSYPKEDFYDPDRLDHDVATGRQVGVVAVAGDGEIAGLEVLTRSDLGPLGRLGGLVVAPAHRGQGLSKRISDRLQVEVKRLGLIGLFNDPITIHTISQQISDELGHQVTGIKLLEVPVHFRGRRHGAVSQWESQAEPGIQRITTVFCFKYLAPPDPKAICAPLRHREMLAKIYRNLEVELQFLEPSHPTGPGELKVHYDQVMGIGTIQVNRIGSDTLPEITQARRDLCNLVGAKVVGLCLPLAQGGTPFLSEAAEADGFFFSGVLPHFAPDGDFLRLQYLNADLDPASIHLYSPFAKELFTYILREKERVGQ